MIRNITEPDIGSIAKLSLLLNKLHAQAHPAIYREINIDQAAELLRERVFNERTLTRFYDKHGIPVGYYVAELRDVQNNPLIVPQAVCYLTEIAVLPAEQNVGIGQSMLTDMKEQARQRGINRLELDVGSFNQSAKHFFSSQGFSSLRERMAMKL